VLYWTDNVERCIHRFDPSDGRDETIPLPDDVMVVTLRHCGGLVLALRKSFAFLPPDADQLQEFAEIEHDRPRNRLNDGKIDRRGRFWAASMDDKDWKDPSGMLWRLTADAGPEPVADEIVCGNGLGWSPDDRTFYLGESFRHAIFAYDFDVDAGTATNERVFAQVNGGGFPDGLTVDAQGGVWSAHNGAGKVVRYAPDGHVTHAVELPVPHPTSCMFGGRDLDVLYVTTARQGMEADELGRYPLSGGLFAVQTPVPGIPEPSYPG